MNVLVYRVEDKNGVGPFRSDSFEIDSMLDLCNHVNGLPLPREEGFRLVPDSFYNDHLICGCTSLEGLETWIPYAVVDDLDSLGFRLVTYSMEFDSFAIEIKETQCVFNQNLATKVDSVPVYELYSY